MHSSRCGTLRPECPINLTADNRRVAPVACQGRVAAPGRKPVRVRAATSELASGPKEAAASRAATPEEAFEGLPEDVKFNTVVVNVESEEGRVTPVYLLGISHVSAQSCDHIEQLIEAVKPEVVMMELCKDRLGLLRSERPRGRQVWHCRKISVLGLPDLPEFPAGKDLVPMLKCRAGAPFGELDIEADANALLSTGLFASVKPLAFPPKDEDAPLFVLDLDAGTGEPRLATVPPLGRLEFNMQMRSLPPVRSVELRLDTSLKAPVAVSTELQEALERTLIREEKKSLAEDMGLLDDLPDLSLESAVAGSEAAEKEAAEKEAAEKPAKTEAEGELTSDDAAEAQEAAVQDTTLRRYLQARLLLLEECEKQGVAGAEVTFRGVDTGKVEVVLRGAADSQASAVPRWGLEDSAEGGSGWGIEPHRMRREAVQMGGSTSIPAQAVERIAASRSIQLSTSWEQDQKAVEQQSGGASATAGICTGRTQWRDWTVGELAGAQLDDLPDPGPVGMFGGVLAGAFSQRQSRVGDKLDVDAGSAWQVALEAALLNGASQIHLGDRPAALTQLRLARSVWEHMLPRLLALPTLLATIAAGASVGLVPEAAELPAAGASCVLGAALVWPIVAPLLEIGRLADMSAEDIEKAVFPERPIEQYINSEQPLKLFGEDALLDWPGAFKPIITERDLFMAGALYSSATGDADAAVSPAFVVDTADDGRPVLRYMMADKGPYRSSPKGVGDAAYLPLEDVNAVVGVVGSAHVPGIVRLLRSGQAKSTDYSAVLRAI